MLQNRKGFTLVELMIVVAIIGILAMVAIPGFMSYIKNSKTSEAKTNLDAIKKGAIAYYEAEHYSNSGMRALSKQYPSMGSVSLLGAAQSDATVGVKQNPNETAISDAMNKAPWALLNFRLTAPFYYSYAYAANGVALTCATENGVERCTFDDAATVVDSTFEATACASLDEAQDSIFAIRGLADGTVTPVLESGACGTAAPPTTGAGG